MVSLINVPYSPRIDKGILVVALLTSCRTLQIFLASDDFNSKLKSSAFISRTCYGLMVSVSAYMHYRPDIDGKSHETVCQVE